MMYDVIAENCNVEIDGFPFYAETITGNEPYPRREVKVTKILGGTEHQQRGEYIPREYTFTTSVEIPPERPHIHDKIFMELINKPCEIVCPDMGGIFLANVLIKKTRPTAAPTTLNLEVTIKEIPGKNSLIPNDNLIIPEKEVL